MNFTKRIYLDYNATTPLAPSVLEAMSHNTWPFGNPSSVHTEGKRARRAVNEVRDFLYETFSLSEDSFDLVFHSGATEGMNTIVKALALEAFKEKKQFTFLYCESDHSCIVNQKGFLETLGHKAISFGVNKDGSVNERELESKIKDHCNGELLVNWTWVNNESGVVFPFPIIEKLKEKYDLKFMVDGVQAVGKINEWKKPSPALDYITFSGHKFGALKGSGFSFIRNTGPAFALLNGGGQQGGYRSGTENSYGIFSLKLALESLSDTYNFSTQNSAVRLFEGKLKSLLGNEGEIVALDNPHRNGNTIYFILFNHPAQTTAMAFDMGGIDLSNGSACSSGAVVPSRVLLGMGYGELEAKAGLRLSFSPFINEKEALSIWEKFHPILSRFIS